ncbi:hypothetical protein DWZ14_01525 [Enterocloster citroniae]|nr:hypothetical protein DWZ14_01525 [Enterocloster citroniae]
MIMKKNVFILSAALLASAWLTACNSGNKQFPEPPATTETKETETTAEVKKAVEFSTGSWNGHTFTSPWLNLAITFPEDCTISTEEDIKKMLGTGQEILVNNGVSNEAQYKAAEFTTTYDFMVILPDQSSIVQMLHENVSVAALGKSMSAEQYLDSVKAQLGALEDYGYEFNDYEDVNIGGQTFTKFSVSALGGAMLQDYYCISKGKYISSIIASYIPDSTETIEAVMAGVTTSK